VAAGFERYDKRRALSAIAGSIQGVNLGVRLAETLMKAFTNDHAVPHNDAANHRVGLNETFSPRGKL
jgi:hypothetical protein